MCGFMSCSDVQTYYIPEAKLYIRLEDNLYSTQGIIYLSKTDNSWKDWIQVQRNTDTNLIIDLKDLNTIYISWNSYKVETKKATVFNIISCDKDSDEHFFKEAITGPRILRDGFICISIGESLDVAWVKTANEDHLKKIQEYKH